MSTAIATSTTALVLPPSVTLLPDTNTHVNRFDFVSESGNVYRIAQSASGRWWGCSCPAWKFNGNGKRLCKHMIGLGIPGGYTPHEFSALQVGGTAPAALPAAKKAPKTAKALPVPAVPAAAPTAANGAPKAPKRGVVPLSVEKKNGKLVVTFNEEDATEVFALLAAMS